MVKKKEEVKVTGSVIPLSRDWVAIINHDGSIVLQHLSQIYVGGSGERVDLLSSRGDYHAVMRYLSEVDPSRVGVRTLSLQTDGSVFMDVDGVSPAGVLSNYAYKVIDTTVSSVFNYFKRIGGKGDW